MACQSRDRKLLRRFFDRYPEYAEPGKIFLSVKGGMSPGNPVTQSEDGLRKDLEQSKRLRHV